MTRSLAIVFLLVASRFAVAAMTDKTPTEKIQKACNIWAELRDSPLPFPEPTAEAVSKAFQVVDARARCGAFINGVSNEMIGELSWLDDTHKKVLVGNFEDGVTLKQEILVFLDYVNQNPAALMNKPATMIFRQAMEHADLYKYTVAP